MKKAIVLFILLVFSTGCATQGAYIQYLDAKKAQVTAERKPLIDLTLTPDGKLAAIKMYPQPPQVDIQQEKDHPGYALAGAVVRIAGIIGSIFVAGEAIEGIVDASTGDSSYINSANNNSENTGTIDQGYSITDTVTTDNSSQ